MPRLALHATLGRVETTVRDHPMRTPCDVEKVPRLPRPGRPARIGGSPRAHREVCLMHGVCVRGV
eukprot:343091-Pyramimonas_sp.AAC.1